MKHKIKIEVIHDLETDKVELEISSDPVFQSGMLTRVQACAIKSFDILRTMIEQPAVSKSTGEPIGLGDTFQKKRDN